MTIEEMSHVKIDLWTDEQKVWLPIWNEIIARGTQFSDYLQVKVPAPSHNDYYDFYIQNNRLTAEQAKTIAVKFKPDSHVCLYFGDAVREKRPEILTEFHEKLKAHNFIRHGDGSWTRIMNGHAFTLQEDGKGAKEDGRKIQFVLLTGKEQNTPAEQVDNAILLGWFINLLY